jgi:predicted transcriptional regulator
MSRARQPEAIFSIASVVNTNRSGVAGIEDVVVYESFGVELAEDDTFARVVEAGHTKVS